MLISIAVSRDWGTSGTTYSDLEIHHLLRERRHLIVEAEPVLSNIIRREHEVALTFLCPIKYHLLSGSIYNVVDIEGATRLDLELFN
jgi:hypothetical protein